MHKVYVIFFSLVQKLINELDEHNPKFKSKTLESLRNILNADPTEMYSVTVAEMEKHTHPPITIKKETPKPTLVRRVEGMKLN